ncbi:hypothetical protein WJX73_002969 [Symbiochloris irregularis]|uniref:TLDc domain-containing protein n=1 Tax=Symbiochloris irregularis TaxID=706552 RepID=A0AAW1NUW8_9CHLO
MINWIFGKQQARSPEYSAAARRFTPGELSKAEAAVQNALGQSKQVSQQAFLAVLGLSGLPPTLASALYKSVRLDQQPGTAESTDLSEEAFMIFLAVCVKGQHDERMNISMPAVQQALASLLPSSVAALGHPRERLVCSLPLLRFPHAARTPELKGCLLTREWLWLTTAWLPPDQADSWELLFNSDMHGASFNTFMGRAASRGPTLLLIKDKQGALFGGFALDPWAKNGQFYGQFGSFVFSLLPAVTMWRPTGINTNFLWCGQGFEQLPNGIGFGGQVGYYALSIDGSFDHGMSRPSATFSNTCLASSEVFQVDTVEVWLTKQPEADPNSSGTKAGSALDRFKEDRHLMEMAGRAVQASRGYREAPPEEDL